MTNRTNDYDADTNRPRSSSDLQGISRVALSGQGRSDQQGTGCAQEAVLTEEVTEVLGSSCQTFDVVSVFLIDLAVFNSSSTLSHRQDDGTDELNVTAETQRESGRSGTDEQPGGQQGAQGHLTELFDRVSSFVFQTVALTNTNDTNGYAEQRSSSLQADMLETLTEMRVLKRGEAEIKLPWFGFEKWLYKVAREKMEGIWNYILPLHGENCLLVYLAMRIYSVIHNHYVRVYNQFSSRELQVKFIDHSNGEVIGESEVETIYTPSRPMSKAYETGYFGSVYKARRKRSKTGGNEQVPQYSSLYPNMEEMREVGSHFYDRILEMMEDEEEWTEKDSVAVIVSN